MIAPAAHTSKGLAKALVSSAGGKGPELLSLQIHTLLRRRGLGGAHRGSSKAMNQAISLLIGAIVIIVLVYVLLTLL
jgi:hypothetical protein